MIATSGHSLKNTPCIEVGGFLKSQNITLNFLGGLEGVMYTNAVTRSFQPNGNPVFVYLPTYSPEMNSVELVFQKLKIVLKREELALSVY